MTQCDHYGLPVRRTEEIEAAQQEALRIYAEAIARQTLAALEGRPTEDHEQVAADLARLCGLLGISPEVRHEHARAYAEGVVRGRKQTGA